MIHLHEKATDITNNQENTNHSTEMYYDAHIHQDGRCQKKQELWTVGKNVQNNWNLCALLVAFQDAAAMENSIKAPQKIITII